MGGDRAKRELPEYEDKPYVYLNIDEVKKSLHYKLNKGMNKNSHINVNDFTLDYAFLLSLGGNDFIHGLPFTVVKNQGIDDFVIPIYRNIFNELGEYLCKIKKDGKNRKVEVNIEFLKELFNELSQGEDFLMKKYKKERIDKIIGGYLTRHQQKTENEFFGYELEINRFEHLDMHHPKHFLNDMYSADFVKIDYSKPHQDWKREYYKFYMVRKMNLGQDSNYPILYFL